MKLTIKGLMFLCTIFFVTSAAGENVQSVSHIIYPNFKAVGELSSKERAQYLREIGEKPEPREHNKVFGFGVKKPYDASDCQIGYLPFSVTSNNDLREVKPAQSISADSNLTRIDVRLDKLKVYDYPGSSGKHQIMFTFTADNMTMQQQVTQSESLTFSQVYEAQEGEGAGVSGYPIFIGLNVGKLGAFFKGATINVKTDKDEKALSALKSKEFQSGLTLLTTAQPALAPLAALGTGIGEMVLSRSKNRKVHECYLGLDFDNGAAYGARLASGNYIIVQASDDEFTWEKWRYDPMNARIVNKDTPSEGAPYNYVIFRVAGHIGS